MSTGQLLSFDFEMSSFKKQLESQNRDKFSKIGNKKLTSLNNKENTLKAEEGRVGGKVRYLGSTKKLKEYAKNSNIILAPL